MCFKRTTRKYNAINENLNIKEEGLEYEFYKDNSRFSQYVMEIVQMKKTSAQENIFLSSSCGENILFYTAWNAAGLT